MIKRHLIIACACMSLLGCAIHHNIEQLSLVVGVAIDTDEKVDKRTGKQNLVLTHQTLISPDRSGMSSSSPYNNIITAGPTIHEITRDVSLKADPVFSQHQRVLLIGEEAGRTFKLDSILDQYMRDNEIRRSCLVFLTKGMAQDILTIKGLPMPPTTMIYEFVQNRYRTNKLLPPLSLGELSAKLATKQSFLVPVVSTGAKSVELNGAAIIKNGRVARFLSQSEIQSVNWLTGEIDGGIVYGKHGKHPYSFEVHSVEHHVKTRINSNRSVHFDVHVETDGRLSEDWNTSNQKVNTKYVNRIEQETEKIIKKNAEATIKKIQQDYKADIIDFREYVRIHHHDFWKKNQKEWDEIFANSTIDYHINVTISDFGSRTGSG
ncbi:Ger(x)C family spore germination protein [Priestia megaterium]|nr:Ger(x)C family spore germination protein [Priestia megaterium]